MSLTGNDWNNIQPSGGSRTLPKGAYVVRISDCTNDASRERIDVVWDVSEGINKGFYSDSFGQSHPNKHHFFVSYRSSAQSLFKRFLDCVDASNGSFSIDSWQSITNDDLAAQAFIGKNVGVAWGDERYTYRDSDGTAREGVGRTFPRWFSVDDIRSGNYTVPDDVDNRDAALMSEINSSGTGPYTQVAKDDLPF